jgi:uncharacterized membrane protein
MIETIVAALIFATAILSGLVAGVFFAFSNFVMPGLGRAPHDVGAAAMRSINVAAPNPGFMALLFVPGLLAIALIVLALLQWQTLPSLLIIAASAIYLIGTLWVTMARNVPLNNALDRIQPGSPEEATLWERYLREWTMWNTVRTIAPALAAMLLTLTLMLR